MQVEIRLNEKCEHFFHAADDIVMIHVSSTFGQSTDCVHKPADNL